MDTYYIIKKQVITTVYKVEANSKTEAMDLMDQGEATEVPEEYDNDVDYEIVIEAE